MDAKKTTNNSQFNLLITKLKENPDIAKGHTRKTFEEDKIFWGRLSEQLNILSVKDMTAWKKVGEILVISSCYFK